MYTSATATIRWRVVLQLIVAFVELFLSSTVAGSYIRNQDCIFSHARTSLILYSLKINKFHCLPFHPFNRKLLNKQVLHKQKALTNQFDQIWWRQSFLIGWDLLYRSFSIYLRYHPDGLGGSVNHCTVNLTTLHPYSINISFTNPNALNPWNPMKLFPSLTRRAFDYPR